MLRKWVEMVNERVNLYLKAMGRMQPGAVAKSPPAPWDVHGAKHFMVTDIPSRWKTPRGPCLLGCHQPLGTCVRACCVCGVCGGGMCVCVCAEYVCVEYVCVCVHECTCASIVW